MAFQFSQIKTTEIYGTILHFFYSLIKFQKTGKLTYSFVAICLVQIV